MSYHRRLRAAGLVAAALLGLTAAAAGASRSSRDLLAEAKAIARRQLAKFGEGYEARIDAGRRLVFISALDDRTLDRTVRLLASFADAYKRTLPASRREWNITVVLPTADDFAATKPPFEGCRGYYSYAGRRLVAIDRRATLIHEFTHALHHADMAAAKQKHPIWIAEGLATLFQSCRITTSGLEPIDDGRLIRLQRALREDDAIPLKDLLAMGREEFLDRERIGLAYAQARYVMFYLHDRDRLDDWYKRYKATFPRDPHGSKAFERTLQSRLFLIEPRWRKWVRSRTPPAGAARMRQARLGLEVKNAPGGVEVVALLPGGAAKQSGRIRVGDVITRFNGHEITNPGELIGAIRHAGAMETVKVELRRRGRPRTVIQPLGAPKR